MSTAHDAPDSTGSGFLERHRRVTATGGLVLLVLLGVLLGAAAGMLLVRLIHLLIATVAGLE